MSNGSVDLDWVTVRAGCSTECVFQQLREQVSSDVEIRKTVGATYRFSFDKRDTNCFSVMATNPATQHSEEVTFTLRGSHIVVIARDKEIKASSTINNEGECMLKIDGSEYTLWQVRKMALEKLFFEVV